MKIKLGSGGDRGSWGKERGKKEKEKEERERREGDDSKGGGDGKLRAR